MDFTHEERTLEVVLWPLHTYMQEHVCVRVHVTLCQEHLCLLPSGTFYLSFVAQFETFSL